jgi:hypothetical protein
MLIRSDSPDLFASCDSEYKATLLDRLEMWATRDDAHVVSGTRQFYGEIAANRAGAVYTELHCVEDNTQRLFHGSIRSGASPGSGKRSSM